MLLYGPYVQKAKYKIGKGCNFNFKTLVPTKNKAKSTGSNFSNKQHYFFENKKECVLLNLTWQINEWLRYHFLVYLKHFRLKNKV